MSRQAAARSTQVRHRRRRRWPFAIAFAALVIIAVGPGSVATSAAGAIGLVLGRPAFDGPLPPCTIGGQFAANATLDDWNRTLLDTEYTLARDYAPTDLVPVNETAVDGDGRIRALVVLDLDARGYAARKDGVDLAVESAYRSYDAQRRTFDSLVAANGREYALESAARPGHSEHQLGTTLDFHGDEAWLMENAWRFGFILSYPADRSPERTCYKAESWHYRYFGRDRAEAIHASGLSPREWLWQHGDEGD
jgi:D-alanyl-D-alanine carboxypeptidase